MTAFYASEVGVSLAVTKVLLAVWCLMSTLEWIRNFDLFKDDGLLSWRILSLRPGRIFRSDCATRLFCTRSTSVVLILRLVAAAALLVSNDALLLCAALLVIVATSYFLAARTWLGEDGADQMGQLVAIGALLMAAGLAAHEQVISFAGTLLIGGQLLISYFVAGFSKLLSPEWRSGHAVIGVMGTHSYGHALGARVLSGSGLLSRGFCWLVILGEMLFPLALFAPHDVLLCALAAFFLFHLTNAWLMGLNTFVWPFAAAYPSVVILGDLTTRSLGLD